MLFLLLSVARAGCPATSADILVALEEAEATFATMAIDGFRAATDRVAADSACIAETLPRPMIARLHRAYGLRAFVDGDTTKAVQAFAAARSIEPAYEFPEALVPPDHPVRARYIAQDPASGGETALPVPEVGSLLVDGRAGAPRPVTRPALFQVQETSGLVAASGYRWPGEPLFEYPVGQPDRELTVAPRSEPRVERKMGASVPLVIAGGVSLVASGALLGLSASSHAAYYDDGVAPKDLESLRSQTNGFYFGFIGTGVAAVGLGLGAVIAGSW